MMKIVLAQILTREMKKQGLTLTSLAKATRVPKSTLFDWLEGRLPSSKNLHYLAELSEFFEITLNELLFGSVEKEPNSQVLFSSSFMDGKKKYKILIEKIDNN